MIDISPGDHEASDDDTGVSPASRPTNFMIAPSSATDQGRE
jgi:hypothetical protein